MTTFTTKNQSKKRYYRALIVAAILFILVAFIIISRQDESLIEIDGVELKGQIRISKNGGMVASYLGVPYSEAPLGPNRFEPPTFPQSSINATKTIEAFYQPIKCYQNQYDLSITEMKGLGDESKEDCLFLNIWTPVAQNQCEDCNETEIDFTKKPVMIFIHSGLFQFGGIGSPELDPSFLVAEKKIIVVTVQYRLGIFGFGPSESQSNDQQFRSLGLQDQAKALEWVNRNIERFGGDPQQVTLAGHGAGKIAILMLIIIKK
ncbi:acetylcholinesterase-like protein 1 [Sarcoptes scabiei]|uniref:Acetylcholinesterase-like protein 1 n=1 Tax=Sarcoptes scabiei TaxID=52283 RepID=A0A132ADI9_SARSC|nr:acetylcholinesterase-like protein 1 [Sarcoptes scabiei]